MHAGHSRVRAQWKAALLGQQIATGPMVKFELLYSARDGQEFDGRESELGELREVAVTRSVINAAMRAFRRLAHARPPLHRGLSLADLLTAASAQDAGVGVLHYDEHFDLLASSLSFESRWIAPRGSLP